MHRGHFSNSFVHIKKQKQILVKVYTCKRFFALVIFYGFRNVFSLFQFDVHKHVFALRTRFRFLKKKNVFKKKKCEH